MKPLFKAAVLIGLGGGAQILAHGLGGFPTVPEILGPFSGKLEGPLRPSHPCGHGEAGVHGGAAIGFRRCLSMPLPPEPRGHSLSPTPGFSRLLYQPPISGLRRLPGGRPGECPA